MVKKSCREDREREGGREGLYPVITDRRNIVAIPPPPLKTGGCPDPLFSQPNQHWGHWPETMMWSEVNIHQGDKTDISERTFLVTYQREVEHQFTINHTTNCVLSPLRSAPFTLLSNTQPLCWWFAEFYLPLFLSVRYPSSSTDCNPTLHHLLPWVFPIANFAVQRSWKHPDERKWCFCAPDCFPLTAADPQTQPSPARPKSLHSKISEPDKQ